MTINDSAADKRTRLSRRRFLSIGATAGLGGMILAACGASGGTGAEPAAAPTAAPAAPAAAATAARRLAARRHRWMSWSRRPRPRARLARSRCRTTG